MKIKIAAAGLAMSLLVVRCVFAGAVIRRSMQSDGINGQGAFTMDQVQDFDGLNSRSSKDMKFTGAMMRFYGGMMNRDLVDIYNLRSDRHWILDSRQKTYSESPISISPAVDSQMEKRVNPNLRVKKTEFSLKPTQYRKNIGAYKVRLFKVAYLLETEDSTTGKTKTYRMSSDIWATAWTPVLRKAYADETAFNQAYFSKMGMNSSAGNADDFGVKLLSFLTGVSSRELTAKMANFDKGISKIDGYAIAVDIRWYVPQISRAESGVTRGGEGGEPMPSIAGLSPAAASAALRQWAQNKIQNQMAAGSSNGGPAIHIRTQIKSVALKTFPPSVFSIPAGYRRKD
ncbi:MAG: hypothetical protein ACYCPQ_09070 [Elusimicrobiota bacterium]